MSNSTTPASEQLSFADTRVFVTAAWAASTSPSRFVDLDFGGDLPAGLPVSGAALRLRLIANAGGESACGYVAILRTSTKTLLATYGGPSMPAACVAGNSYYGLLVPLSDVATTDIANDLTVRLHFSESNNRPTTLDLATVVGAAPFPFTLRPVTVRDVASAVPVEWPWALAAQDGVVHVTDNWENFFQADQHLSLEMLPNVPAGAQITRAVLSHRYSGGKPTASLCTYIQVFDGTTLLLNHGNQASPLSCVTGNTNFVDDRIELPELTTGATARRLVVRIYANDADKGPSVHDTVSLSLDYVLPANPGDTASPLAADVQILNGGGTTSRPDQGDTMVLSFTEPILATSILAGWDGSSTNVTVRITDNGGSDSLMVYDAANATQVPLGIVMLSGDYVSSDTAFGASGVRSTMSLSGGVVTVILGAQNSGAVRTESRLGALRWTPRVLPTDLAGNLVSGDEVGEAGALDADF